MTTGDLKNNLRKLISAIKGVEYPGDPDIEALSQGSSEAFLVIYHHAFLDYSRPVAQLIVEKNIDLSGKSDGRFVEGMYKALREIFSFKPALTQSQFFSRAFSEQKIIMGTEILQKIKEKHKRLGPKPKPRDPALLRKTNSTSSSRPVSAPVKMVDELDHMISTAVTNEKKKVALTSPVTQKVISPIMELSREKKVTFRDKSQDHVEIVYDTATNGDCRPFDVYALTPGKHPLTSSPLPSQKVDELTKKVSKVEESLVKIIQRLDDLEGKLSVPQAPSPPSSSLLETLSARLTLIENKMEIQENEKAKSQMPNGGDYLQPAAVSAADDNSCCPNE